MGGLAIQPGVAKLVDIGNLCDRNPCTGDLKPARRFQGKFFLVAILRRSSQIGHWIRYDRTSDRCISPVRNTLAWSFHVVVRSDRGH